MNKMFGKFFVDPQMVGDMICKIDVIYAFPLLAGGIGLFVLLFTYWIWKLYHKITAEYAIIIQCFNLLKNANLNTDLILRNTSDVCSKLKNSNILKSQIISDVSFYVMEAQDVGFKMKLPMLKISQTVLDSNKNENILESKEFIYWEGLQYLLDTSTDDSIYHKINLVSYNKAKADFISWKSKPIE